MIDISILIIIGLPAIVIATISVFVMKQVLPVNHFLYSNARLVAKPSIDSFEDLISSNSLREFKTSLNNTGYIKDLEQVDNTLRSVHTGLEKAFNGVVAEVIELSPEKTKPILDAYLHFYETKVLKAIYRAKLANVEITKDLIRPIGIIDQTMLDNLYSTETIADIAVVMGSTIYSGLFKEYATLEEFEKTLDQFVLDEFVKVLATIKMYDSAIILELLNRKVDMMNILTIMKLRIRGVKEGFFINNKTLVCQRSSALLEAESMEKFIELLDNTPYHQPMQQALEKYDKDNSLSHFENELFRAYKKLVISGDLGHTLGPYPLFSYLIKKEFELRNLFVISRGIDADFSKDKIKEMII
jgi:vacuolar-type H+-ATPase subunit C/Vma6